MTALIMASALVPAPAYAEGVADDVSAVNAIENASESQSSTSTEGEQQQGGVSSSAGSQDQSQVDGEVIVVFKDTAADGLNTLSTQQHASLDTVSNSCELVAQDENSSTVKANLRDGVSVDQAVDQLSTCDNVEIAQPNFRYHLLDTVDDPAAQYSTSGTSMNQWGLYSVGAFDAWDTVKCQGSVTVAVVDTGINFDHEDLKNNIDTQHAYDVVTGSQLTENDTDGHGTHVAGIIAAEANNGLGVAGVSYNAKILPVNVFSLSSTGELGSSTADLVKAYDYLDGLIDSGEVKDLHVVNMSLGGYETDSDDEVLEKSIAELDSEGVVTVAAAGNGNGVTGYTSASYPSDFEECVSVTSLDSDGLPSSFSDHNESKDIAAPGRSIWSTYRLNSSSYKSESGTSMASPMVAGAFALLYAENPDLDTSTAKQVIYDTATPLDDTGAYSDYGHGKLNVAAAVADPRVTSSLPASVMELQGSTRYDTMQQIVDEYCKTASEQLSGALPSTVIVASGENFPDALSASALAGAYSAPIVLTSGDSLSDQAAQEISSISPSKIIIIGGSAAISSNVESSISSIMPVGCSLERVFGSDRVGTSLAIYGNNRGSWGSTAILASADTFADALSAAPMAYASLSPVFLCSNGAISQETLDAISNGGFTKVIVVGGTAVIPDSTLLDIWNASHNIGITRLAGSDRYKTSQAVASYATSNGILNCSDVGFSSGQKAPDAQSAAPLMGMEKCPLLLVDDSEAGMDCMSEGGFVADNAKSIKSIKFFGGSVALPQQLRTAIIDAINSSRG